LQGQPLGDRLYPAPDQLITGAKMKRNAALRTGLFGTLATILALAAPAKAGSQDLAAVSVAGLTKVPAHFTRDVLPVLTKVGCNQGACHGQQGGKGGFKLSLRAWDALYDYEQITKDASGKRIAGTTPTETLLLKKATGQLKHGGGKVLEPTSDAYRTIEHWLKLGAPASGSQLAEITRIDVTPKQLGPQAAGIEIPLTVIATYADGYTRDVTSWARFQAMNEAVASVDSDGNVSTSGPGDGTVLVSYDGEVATLRVTVPYAKATQKVVGRSIGGSNPIDAAVSNKLNALGLIASPRASDDDFLRRVYLDTLALLPTVTETRAFLSDTATDKRSKLIDQLLARREHAQYRALRMADLLRVNGQFLSEEGADTYSRWLEEQAANNVPYDKVVRELLTSKGSTYRTGPANFYRVANTPPDLAETTAQAFLGTRIGCAKCHNHPFERWKQSDYYSFAAFFARFQHKYGPEFGEVSVMVRQSGEVGHPKTGKPMSLRPLGGSDMVVPDDQDRRAALAAWLTSPSNRLFADVAVNRIWAEYFGVGIVDSTDDFRGSNPPSNPELLAVLSDTFIKSGFDVRAVERLILTSETYQRSSIILPGNRSDTRYYARAYPRRLPAEAMIDAIGVATGRPERFYPYPAEYRATMIRDSRIQNYFLETFGRPKREVACTCERSDAPNLSQALHLINSGFVHYKVTEWNGKVMQLMEQAKKLPEFRQDSQIIEELYLSTLCRYPTASEQSRMLAYIREQKDRKVAFEDCLWGLLNAEEFVFNK
jgi:hypothetical protein